MILRLHIGDQNGYHFIHFYHFYVFFICTYVLLNPIENIILKKDTSICIIFLHDPAVDSKYKFVGGNTVSYIKF